MNNNISERQLRDEIRNSNLDAKYKFILCEIAIRFRGINSDNHVDELHDILNKLNDMELPNKWFVNYLINSSIFSYTYVFDNFQKWDYKKESFKDCCKRLDCSFNQVIRISTKPDLSVNKFQKWLEKMLF